MFRALWKLAERADWYGWPPRALWHRVLRWCDERSGYYDQH